MARCDEPISPSMSAPETWDATYAWRRLTEANTIAPAVAIAERGSQRQDSQASTAGCWPALSGCPSLHNLSRANSDLFSRIYRV
jgi:hypothetical protein